ncbi:ABC transporter permease [Paenarthrobacter aurescens]|uniref:Polysaccharide ABC transporter ATP-binding protein n=1 Tax=Paenarthrobacter aurescens TaxID=43663 RepID=A0A4Y3NCK3_PAEAU|nr:ABC transporter permease subunit [Paenarthrobacter aurescens]MDO6145402.1 ABC transporter permease subunit [Paenarthrobacter aurescens]MDO6149207.1 ABC transporter permease subunit [Paenarthrobacter aurescens]MDO6160451.1 ABC transporter permease subunit [Paenarthrobacter aurescens]MDO6164310.1 ABC transporter permease subunit [Paenarthrobacter aurescens]GEB19570.1 polysaccharide ABC transporter ATP-binding protein [Paenarthrobacter aurescens]
MTIETEKPAASAGADTSQAPHSGSAQQTTTGKSKSGHAKSGKRLQEPGSGRPRAGKLARFKRDRSLVFMALPAVLLLAVFAYLPMLGNVVAFQEYSPFIGFADSPWVGLENFSRVFSDPDFWMAVKNTLVITAFQLVFFFPIPIALAILLNSLINPKLRSAIQAVVYLPHFFSWVLVVSVFQQLFGGAGLLNQSLRANGWEAVDVMTNPDTFLFLITSQAIWKDAGWGIIVFLAALSAIDPAQYEAAAVDGAGPWKRMWHVTLPGLRSVIVLLLILRLGDSLSVGFEQLILQRDAVGAEAAEVLDTFVYYTGVQNGDWSYAAAAGLIKGVISLALILAANKVAHIFGESGVYSK